MTQLPLAVGDVYFIGGVARLKLTISAAGVPVSGLSPTVTIIRDSDNFAVNFIAGAFEATTPATLSNSQFRTSMVELGLGTYYYDFDPTAFNENSEEVYTVIYRNGTIPSVTAHSEFQFNTTQGLGTATGFGVVDRCCNVCLNEPTVISYEASPGQTDVVITVYNPFDVLLISNATMSELDDTGIYQYTFTGTLEGDYTLIMSEAANGSSDALILTVGGSAERLKRMEALLRDLALNTPTVRPCQ